MAKVIKQGLFQKECSNCKSLIEFSVSELKKGQHTDYTGDTDYFRYLKCPSCKEEMYFPQYKI